MNYHFYLSRIDVYIGVFFGNTWEEARDKMLAKYQEPTTLEGFDSVKFIK